MPKRKRARSSTGPSGAGQAGPAPRPAGPAPVAAHDSPPPPAATDPAVAEALRLFAERERATRDAEQRARTERGKAAAQASEMDRLRKVKDDAVARLKAVRRQEQIAPGDVEAAEAAYTAATADLVEAETGQRPSWAPARPAEADGDIPGPDDAEPGSPDRAADADEDGAGPAEGAEAS